MFYKVPLTLPREIDELENLIAQFKGGQLEFNALKAHRDPFGVYEQRQADTYMIRIRCPGGAITPSQLVSLSDLSDQYAADFIHITTRQEMQFHQVKLDDVIPLIRDLYKVGLSTRGGGGNTIRNIMASTESGISKDEVFNVQPYAHALTTRLISEPSSWVLPRKFKISFSASKRDTANATIHDLGFVATEAEGKKGFKVYMAGGMGNKPQVGHLVHEFIETTESFF